MRRPGEERAGGERLGLAGAGLAALVVVCCATLPLLAGLAGGIAVAAVLGVAAGLAVAAGVTALVVILVRRHRSDQRS